jgi:NADPH2:quinone reductase
VCGWWAFPALGGYGESVVAREEELVRLDGVASGKALPLAGLTAWQGLFEHGALKAGQRVLILAGAGASATWRCSLPTPMAPEGGDGESRQPQLPAWAGASRMVDYHDADWRQVVAGGPVDLVLDLVGGESGKAALACVKPGGRLVTVPTITAQQIKDAAGQRHRGARHAGAP